MNKKTVSSYLLGILPIIIMLSMYSKLPELVPTQWNGSGVSEYGQKWELIPLSCIGLIMAIGMPFMKKIDPKKDNYKKFTKSYENTILAVQAFLLFMIAIVVFESLYPNSLMVTKMVISGVGILFIFIGNMMPKIKSNFFTGYKNPWTLSNEVVWNKTHRLGGKFFFLEGIILFIVGLYSPSSWVTPVVMSTILMVCFIPTTMSYIWFQKELKRQ